MKRRTGYASIGGSQFEAHSAGIDPGVSQRKAQMDPSEKSRRTLVSRCDQFRPSAQPTTQSKAGHESVGRLLLGVSMLGLPVTLVVVRWMGSLGRVCALVGYGILFTRACFMIRSGAPVRMRPLTALLLYAELVADAIGCGVGLWAWVFWPLRLRFLARTHATARMRDQADASRLGWVALVAAGPIYVLHTIRLLIYISPGRGLRDPVRVGRMVRSRPWSTDLGSVASEDG